MHVLWRVLFFLVQPSHLALLLIGLGLLILFLHPTRARLGKLLAATGFVALVVLGFSPIGYALLLPLEERFPRRELPTGQIRGIIFLGGFEDPSVSHARSALILNESAERLTEAVLIARAFPDAKIVFTGGASEIFMRSPSGASAVGGFLEAAGIPAERIVLEDRSRNTYENAIETGKLVDPKPGEHWLLVTSAWHMPRAVGTFRHAGFDVIPWPTDYRTRGTQDFLLLSDKLTEGLRRTDTAVREWIGLIAYWLLGRSEALFPAPSPTA